MREHRQRTAAGAPRWHRAFVVVGSALLVALLAGCGGGGGERGQTTDTAAKTGGVSADAAPASPQAGAGAASGGAAGTPAITPQMIALGDSIFHGQAAGGLCQTCHGPDAKGTTLAPNLTDDQWLNGDGSYQFIVTVVTNGVLQPKQYPAPMPPMGGASLTPDQVRAVAAYVYSLRKPAAGSRGG